MPLEMSSELRFPMGASVSLDSGAVDDFLGFARRITSPDGTKWIIEKFKEYFCKASGSQYISSSNLSWAESDMEREARDAAEHAPGFIAAFCDACAYLEQRGIAVPGPPIINKILSEHGVSYQIINNVLLETDEYVRPPEPHPSISRVVDKAISNAKSLIGQSGASSAIDRAHTALHGYLVSLCNESGIETCEGLTASKAFKLLREQHAAFSESGPRSYDVNRVLQAFATSIDAFATIRNKASLAHANELLDDPEATAMVNAMFTIFRYIQDSLRRHKQF